MMTALIVWMGLSGVTTLGLLSAVALGSRRHIPAVRTDGETESGAMVLLNRDGNRESKFAPSFAR